MSRREGAADDAAIRDAMRDVLAEEVGGKSRARRVAEAIVAKAEKGQPGAVRELQDRLLGKPAQHKFESPIQLSEETAQRIADLAEKFAAPCTRCGYVDPMVAGVTTQPKADSGSFQAYEPPKPPKAPAVEPEAKEKPPVLRQKRDESAEAKEGDRKARLAGAPLPKL